MLCGIFACFLQAYLQWQQQPAGSWRVSQSSKRFAWRAAAWARFPAWLLRMVQPCAD